MNIYAVDCGERILSTPSDTGQINVTCCVEWASLDGTIFGQIARVTVPIPANSANWANAFENAVRTWAAGLGHSVTKLVMADYSVR